ncbi:ZNF1 [Coprinopsis cinerea okayama7|uniref:ZNF1 n=1 Tax=Coprinopsis cinerea (strain Okayama-7 / 130 / ATCC MYA-4618 / FGSC 9003) TaxID=240176 RepID=A8N8P9_COPC7|nr:ZNF1 [Coprinopsis cinerea okayama7\|eukprot:XP_001831227.2 ZNF1 [Coprinopsis cinerea okayama7\
MQFLPPADAPKGEEGKNYHYTRVRLAWYYRPSDVSDRPVADSRLLLAAIYSEVCDINQLRAKCHVVHRDKISDLSGWKKRPDRFYFNRLFDPYIKKEFEVIPSRDVRNLPDHIREVLISRYEYIVAEKEVIPDLTDHIRLCDNCQKWCPSADTVQCDRCKRFFHMRCVQPPLLAKPTRGYGWTCAPCSRRHEEEVDSHDVRPSSSAAGKAHRSNAPPARGRGRPRKDKTLAEKEENLPVKHFKMWPFRYFGQHTVAEDTLDEEDLIFPRTATRHGPKYQANVPPGPDPYNYPPDLEERGGDNTVEVLGVINSLTESEVEACKKGLTNDPKLRYSVDWLTEVIFRFSDAALAARPLTAVNMKNPNRIQKWKKYETPYTDRPWSHDEVVAFEDAVALHGPELRAAKDEVPNRSMPEVVRFFGHWKNSKLKEENKRLKTSGPPAKPIHRQYRSAAERSDGQRVGLGDDEGSIVAQPSKSPSCGACRTRESPQWWKAPKGLPTNILCETCGTNWRKYADLNVRPIREESLPTSKAKTSEKREGTPPAGPSAKRARSTPPPVVSAAPQVKCFACHKQGPLGKVLRCKKCQFRAHAGCVGAVVGPAKVDEWTCELCENEETMEASINYDCLLCPRSGPEEKKQKPWPPADTFLRACKPTEGQGWTHVICAVFLPELSFTDASRLRLVEGMSTIAKHRWTTKCCLCGEMEGAVVKCSDCYREFHVSCAWKEGHKFGFEIQPVKSSRRDTTITTTFKGESGCMSALISCKMHDHNKRDIYDICETNEGGETALQVYCQAYKQAQVGQAHGLLRKAKRLDALLNLRDPHAHGMQPVQELPTTEPECSKCNTQFSPAFYPVVDLSPTASKETWLCHRCHFEANVEVNGKAMGMMIS